MYRVDDGLNAKSCLVQRELLFVYRESYFCVQRELLFVYRVDDGLNTKSYLSWGKESVSNCSDLSLQL